MKRSEIIELLVQELHKKQADFSPEDLIEEEKLLRDTLEAPFQDNEVGIGSIVKILMNGKDNYYFFATTMGGTLLRYKEMPLLVISIFSGFASELIGKTSGQKLMIEKEGRKRELQILSIH